MKKSLRSDPFRKQIRQAMRELREIITAGTSPTAGARLTARTYEVTKPTPYDARRVKALRAALNVSQAVFARLLGVSDVLVRSWEHGIRRPAPIACRLLDQIQAHPKEMLRFIRTPETQSRVSRTAKSFMKRNGRGAA